VVMQHAASDFVHRQIEVEAVEGVSIPPNCNTTCHV
jgi:hypothetical protein